MIHPEPPGNDLPEVPVPRPDDPEVTPELVADHGLSPDEYDLIMRHLGRPATFTELGVFSAMWSEHCGYKHSKRLLRLLPTRAPWVIQGPGENAGVIDIGDGRVLAFKVESHNHPSAVEPYQGAATGVGGILRDVFTMGARPVAVLDSLHFGDLESPRVRYLLDGVVRGVGDYGNCVGIPNLGGEAYFDRGYEGNPIINVMCLGIMKRNQLIRGEARGAGNTLMAVGARTGRDGIHGATFASEELDEDSDASRPQVQVGDPFTEKLLLEASLELIRSGHIVGIQDMGAAGITSSAAEMAGRSGSGVVIDTAHVPVREPGMTPYEILLSESQERMLVVAHRGCEADVLRILAKWELEAAEIGRVTDDGRFRILEDGRPVADIPVLPLTEGCPTYERDAAESAEIRAARGMNLSAYARPEGDRTADLMRLLASPNIASRRWIYEQYDTTVRTSSVVQPGGDAGVLRVAGTRQGIAVTIDCSGRYTYLEPRAGTRLAVAEAARNLVCTGALPVAVTNNLNFGNPLKPHIFYQLREAVLGMAEACALFETPVTGGNVSLYNETSGSAIYPTPVIGMVGIIEDLECVTRHGFRREGDVIVLLGRNTEELGGSEYLYALHGVVGGPPPSVNLMAERALQQAVLAMIRAGLLRSAHDCSEGGLACALVECALSDGEDPFGIHVQLADTLPPAPLFFGEAQGRILVSCDPGDLGAVRRSADRFGVPVAAIGKVGAPGGSFVVESTAGSIEADIEDIASVYFGTLPERMGAPDRR